MEVNATRNCLVPTMEVNGSRNCLVPSMEVNGTRNCLVPTMEVNGTRNCLVNDILLYQNIGWMDSKMVKLNCLTLRVL